MDQAALDAEALFGQLVVDNGLSKPEKVQECLDILRRLAARGIQPLPRLSDMLVERGYMSLDDFQKTKQMTRPATALAKPAATPPATAPAEAEVKPSASEPQGERFGKYVKTEKLGEGGAGEVWKAWDTQLKRWVAIKFLKSTDKLELARFRREAQLAAGLDHPGIAAIYESGEGYLVMQLVPGRTLSSVPKGEDPRRVAEIVRQAALAVQFAHERGVIHRDLKPANVMFDEPGTTTGGTPKPLRVCVMDFGLAKVVDMESSLSVSGTFVGTPGYMSPEQAAGRSDLTPATDVYSLGATLYTVLAGRSPFVADNLFDLLKKIQTDEPPPMRRWNVVPPDLETIAMKCLEKDPARRYASAFKLAEDLKRFVDGEPILARPLSPVERAWRFVKRHRTVSITVLVVLVAVNAVLGGREWVRARGRAREVRRLVDLARSLDSRAPAGREEDRKTCREARDHLLQALKLNPGDADAKALLAKVEDRLAVMDREDAEAREREAKKRKDAERRLKRALLLTKVVGDWERIRDTIRNLEELYYDSTLPLETRRQRAEKSWARVQLFMDRTDPDPFAQAGMWALAGWARCLAGYEDEAIAWLRKSTELDPEQPYGHLMESYLVFYRFADRTPFPTVGLGRRFLDDPATFPESAELLRRLGDLLRRVGDLSTLAKEDPESANTALGAVALLGGKFDEAEKHFGKAISAPELDEFLRNLHMVRARTRYHQGKYKEALEDLEKVAPSRLRHAPTHLLLGQVRSALALWKDSVDSFDRALKYQPGVWYVFVARARARIGDAEYDAARADCEDALKLEPRAWQAHYLRGVALEEKGLFSEAVTSYEAALRVLEHAEVRAALDRARRKGG